MFLVCSDCVYVCARVYLQVVVVSPAAAVELLGGVLVHVENGADVTEIPRFGDDKLLT